MRRHTNEHGAVIIHVALALVALLAFCTFVFDQGVMYVARRQAQNAADAGALAGAISMMNDPGGLTLAEQTARHFAGRSNAVWGAQTPDADIAVSPLPMTCPPDVGGGEACIRVDVFRGTPDRDGLQHTNHLPMFMGHLIGLNRQGVRATATAQVAAGNSVNCIRPWAVVDRWTDNSETGSNTGGWDQQDTFNPGVDTYTPPGFRASGPDNDIGTQLMLKGDDGLTPGGEWSSGWSMRIELGGGNGADPYRDEIRGCPGYVPEVGIYDGSVPCAEATDQNFPAGCINVRPGVAQGPTSDSVNFLVNLDDEAEWDTATKGISGGCTEAGNCSTVDPEGDDFSPRVIPLALFNPQACLTNSCSNGNNTVVQVVNIMGFFLEGMCSDVYASEPVPAWCGSHPDKVVVGRIMNYPGQGSRATGSAGPWSFLKVVRLVR